MINCPYCGEEISEDIAFCARCQSMLITDLDAEGEPVGKKGMAYRLIRPWAAAALILVISAVLFFIFRNPSFTSASSDVEALSGEFPGSLEKGLSGKASGEKGRRGKAGGDKKAELYAQILEYENRIDSLFDRAQKLPADPDILAGLDAGEDATAGVEKKFEEIRPLLLELRKLRPPPGLERCQSSLVNSMSMIQSAIRSEMMYIQSRDSKHLEDARSRQDSSRSRKEYAFEILNMVKTKNAPPAPRPEEAEKEPELEDKDEVRGEGGGRAEKIGKPEPDELEEMVAEEEPETVEVLEGEDEELEGESEEEFEVEDEELVEEFVEEGDEYLEPGAEDEYLESETGEGYEQAEEESFEEEEGEGEGETGENEGNYDVEPMEE